MKRMLCLLVLLTPSLLLLYSIVLMTVKRSTWIERGEFVTGYRIAGRRFRRLSIRQAPGWAWLLLAVAPTAGYLIARALIEWRTQGP